MMENLFHKTTWSKAIVGDIVLKAWESPGRIVEVEIKQIVTEPGMDGKLLVIARFAAFGCEFGQAFDPEETAYVQSRFQELHG